MTITCTVTARFGELDYVLLSLKPQEFDAIAYDHPLSDIVGIPHYFCAVPGEVWPKPDPLLNMKIFVRGDYGTYDSLAEWRKAEAGCASTPTRLLGMPPVR